MSYLSTEILDYVGTHEPDEAEGFGIGQRELAKALGYHPCSMSRPLTQLVHEGDLQVRRAPVRGGIRKQKVYALTDTGRSRLMRQGREVPLLSSALPPPPNPFVGRREELQELYSRGREGGVIVHVEGSTGMGKTALVARALRRLRLGHVPFWFTARPASSARHFTLSLAHALSTLGSRQLAYYAQLPREPVGREVADLARRALGENVLLGVIDDVHAAPSDFRSFLAEFATAFIQEDRPDCLYTLGQEPTFIPPTDARLRVIRLGGIDRTAAHELTDRRGGLGERFEAVFQATRGSPLLLQLAVSAPEVATEGANLPALVVGRLPELDVQALLPAALSNEPVPLTFVQDTGGLSVERIHELTEQGLLQRASEGRVEVLQAVRGALVARVAPSIVRSAHLELAQFYGRSHRSEAVRERFLHLIAGEAWKLAGELLRRQEATLLASGYSNALRSALRQLTQSSPHDMTRVRSLRAEAHLLRVHSEYPEAISCLRRAATESERDPRSQAECLLSTVELHIRLQQNREAEQAIAEARQVAPESRRLQVFFAYAEGRVTEGRGDFTRARDIFAEAFEMARKSRQEDLALEALTRWSRLVSLTSKAGEVRPLIDAGIPEARNSGRMDIVFNLMSVRAWDYSESGRHDLAMEEINKIRVEAEALGYLSQLVYAFSGLSGLAVELSRWEEATGYARQASELAERLGNELVLGHTLALQCASEVRRDLLPDAQAHGERAIAVLSKLSPTDSLPIAHAYLCEAYARASILDKALEHYDLAIRLAENLGMIWWRNKVREELYPLIHGGKAPPALPATETGTTETAPQ